MYYDDIQKNQLTYFDCLVQQEGTLYITGKERVSGGLGLHDTQQANTPQTIPGLEHESFIDIACSSLHSLAVHKNGQIWSWGCNEFGALGRNGDATYPQPITHTSIKHIKFKKVACGNSVSLALTTKNRLYAWGKFMSREGEYGFLPDVDKQEYPRIVQEISKFRIIDIAAGASHCLALDVHGHIYSWGCGELDLLGYKTSQDWKTSKQCLIPTKLPLQDIVSIECGSFHSIALGAFGQVYTWGLNHFNQCGAYDPETATNQNNNGQKEQEVVVEPILLPYFKKRAVFKLIKKKPLRRKRLADEAFASDNEGATTFQIERSNEPRAIRVAAGDYHTMALMSDNTLVVWGRCEDGQLGISLNNALKVFLEDESGNIYAISSPILNTFKFTSDVKEVKCGSSHTLVLCKDGNVFGFGESKYGQLGINSEVEHTEKPTTIQTINEKGNVFRVGSGGDVSLFLVNNKEDGSNSAKNT